MDAMVRPEVYVLLPEEFPAIREKFGELIKKGLRRGRGYVLTEEAFWDRAADGEYVLWAVTDGHDIITITALEIYEGVGGKFLTVVALAGHWSDQASEAFHKNLRQTAKRMGIDHVETFTRKGMVGRLKQAGWSEVSTIMKLEI